MAHGHLLDHVDRDGKKARGSPEAKKSIGKGGQVDRGVLVSRKQDWRMGAHRKRSAVVLPTLPQGCSLAHPHNEGVREVGNN